MIIDWIESLWRRITSLLTKKEEALEDDTLRCPKCKNDKWIEGPGGGSFGNIQCGKCNTKYNNMGPFGLHEIK